MTSCVPIILHQKITTRIFTQKELKKAPMDIDAWLEDLLNEQKIPEGIECRRAINAGILVPFDSEYLRRAVINVVTNAVYRPCPTILKNMI